MSTKVLQVQSGNVALAARRAGKVLRAGGLVGFPTETVYGVAAVAADEAALERLRELKGRPNQPFSVHMGAGADAKRYVREIPADAARLMAKAWPGPVTLLLRAGGKLADQGLRRDGLYERLCADDVIGLRCPDSPVAAAMLRGVDGPVVASSANLAGLPSPRSAEDVLEHLDGKIDLLLDEGPTRYGKDSTIVDFSADPWRIARRGVYDARMIRQMLLRRILFVCTGNTCRSPIAAGLARAMLAKRLGVRPQDLEERGLEIASAGMLAGEASRPSPEAVAAARELGADISRHRTRKLTNVMVQEADAVFGMTEFHVAEIGRLAPGAGAKVRRLDEAADIADPMGMAEEEYRRVARRIQQALRSALDRSPAAEIVAGGRLS